MCVCVCVQVLRERMFPEINNSEKCIYMESNISIQISQVPFFSSLTLIIIFKVKLFAFYLFCEYLVNGERLGKYYFCYQTESNVFSNANGATADVFHHNIDLHFQGYELGDVIIQKIVKKAKNAQERLLQMLIFAIDQNHSESCTPRP